ncbi:MAG: zinc ABC transporter substrate-binding protein [Lentisphaeria bacterium]|nr:zinc ABC transporter substrate-binding protein [Lentisphaeria bacterium]
MILKRCFPALPGLAWICLTLSAAGGEPRASVWTSLPPLAWLTRHIAGETISVNSLLSPGQDPHTFSPRPKELVALKDARFFLHCGTDFEQVLAKKIHAMSPEMVVENVWTDPDHAKEGGLGAGHGESAHEGHQHGHDCSVHADGKDPHVWMSPVNLIRMAGQITTLLAAQFPDQQKVFTANLADLTKSLRAADTDFAGRLAAIKGTTFYVYHPAFGHFADRYHLIQKAVEVEGKTPTPKQLLSVIQSARKEGVTTIIASPQFSERSSRILARKIGGTVVKVDPLNPDPLAAMRQLTDALLGETSATP